MLFVGLLVFLGLGLCWFFFGGKISRKYQEPVVHLSPETMAGLEELQQPPGWWERQHHAALEASNAPRIEIDGGEITERSFDGSVAVSYHMIDVGYLDCMCGNCVHVRDRYNRYGEGTLIQ